MQIICICHTLFESNMKEKKWMKKARRAKSKFHVLFSKLSEGLIEL